jgi:hypothetical protein
MDRQKSRERFGAASQCETERSGSPYVERRGQILAACDRIGGGIYNRSGAKYEQLERGRWLCKSHTKIGACKLMKKTDKMVRRGGLVLLQGIENM